jgi:hypothetical protein
VGLCPHLVRSPLPGSAEPPEAHYIEPMIDRTHLADLRAAEERRFVEAHPRSQDLSRQAADSLLAGLVP